jgi:6-pyruvoyltetrahydropterin/6-carboxytetrahydropterin synthase
MTFRVEKHYGHDAGLSCCFRQHKAESHCRLLHGYALAFTFTFECKELDERNWCIDFGGLDGLKKDLKHSFDHTLAVAADDPMFAEIMDLKRMGLANVLVLPKVGCEAFAEFAWAIANMHLRNTGMQPRVRVVSCKVSEHGANSAIYIHKGIDVHA